MNYKYRYLTLLTFICFQQSGLAAEEGAIVPDRPGLSTGTHAVAPGTVYLEMGYQYAFNRSGEDTATHTLPQLVMRTGITEDIELDIIWDGKNQDHTEGLESIRSSSDITIGGKYQLHESDTYNLTLFGLVSLATGSAPSTSDDSEPLLGLLWDYNVTDSTQLFGAIQANWLEDEEEDTYTESQFIIGVGFSHTDKLATFVEYYAAFPGEAGLPEEHIFNGGVTYLYSNDMQLDISAGVGLNDNSGNFISAGIAVRF